MLLALALTGCASSATDYCGKVCSVHQGTSGPIDAEGGPLSASCPVGFTCDGTSSTCVANDGHCATSTATAGSGNGTSAGTTG